MTPDLPHEVKKKPRLCGREKLTLHVHVHPQKRDVTSLQWIGASWYFHSHAPTCVLQRRARRLGAGGGGGQNHKCGVGVDWKG